MVILLSVITTVYAQRTINFEETTVYRARSGTSLIRVTKLVPTTIPGKQTLLNIACSIPAKSVWKEGGKTYATFEFANPRDSVVLTISSVLKLYRNDWRTAQQRLVVADTTNKAVHLQHEPNFQARAHRIRQTADSLIGKTEEETVRNIFNFVVNHLEYHRFPNDNRGAKRALRQGRGDCTEYSELMIALCRANGIPARIANGFVTTHVSDNPRHNWVEVYFSDVGWVAFDPTFADGGITTFERMRNAYVYLSYDRFDDKLGYRYYGNPPKITRRYKVSSQLSEQLSQVATYYNNHKYDSAQLILTHLIAEDASNPKYYEFSGMILARKGEFDKALIELQKCLSVAYFAYEKRLAYYAFANMFSLKGDKELALSYLEAAFEHGFRRFSHAEKDEDLKSLWKEGDFQNLLNTYKSRASAEARTK